MALFGKNDQNEDRPQGNPSTRIGLMTIVSGYIIYLGVNILRSYFRGEEGMPGYLAILFGGGFIVVGAVFIVYFLRQYMQLKKSSEEENAAAGTAEEAGTADAAETAEEAGTADAPETAEAALEGTVHTIESGGSAGEADDPIDDMNQHL